MSNFQNPKVPVPGGSHLPYAHPSSFEIPLELDHGRRVWRLGRNNWFWRLSDDVAARWR